VFGAENTLSRNRTAVDHVLTGLKIVKRPNEDINNCIVIIKRKHRRIVNTNELEAAAIEVGFNLVEVVYLEQMSVKRQLTMVANAGIIVGVHGAGLQWAIFMPAGATLIEVAWPQNYWSPVYGFVKNYSIEYTTLKARDVLPNWRAFEFDRRKGRTCSEGENMKLLNNTYNSIWDPENIWRYADVKVDRKEFTKLIKRVRYEKEIYEKINRLNFLN